MGFLEVFNKSRPPEKELIAEIGNSSSFLKHRIYLAILHLAARLVRRARSSTNVGTLPPTGRHLQRSTANATCTLSAAGRHLRCSPPTASTATTTTMQQPCLSARTDVSQ